ncbi:DUF4865 family protein [Kitasatospora mediocidica]|uniref:DUF4865 family protein n=1 Tax=Kitasatospora mediocidica TaxID=58352 RepID=UPI0005681C67|nr:DUF4865 family protein [Kitasatospora mediocidica]
MQAMQYEITLPADYDMRIIRRRVADRGHLLDGFPGLGLKAYLIRERGTAGSPVNQYAPFYLWNSTEGMNSFLWGPGFQGINDDFGRPVVRHWLGLAFQDGPARAVVPRSATRSVEPVPPGRAPAEAVARALERLPDRAEVHSTALAVDTARWELTTFTLWDGPEAAAALAPDGAERYEVLHLSAPEREKLPQGRHW